MKRIFACHSYPFFLLLICSYVFSEQKPRDIVFLHNGSIIKGNIIEKIPGQTLKIQTADGSLFVYSFADIDSISSEKPLQKPASHESDELEPNPESETVFSHSTRHHSFELLGGLAIPVGAFGETQGEKAGGAGTGFVFGADMLYPIGPVTIMHPSILWTHNSVNTQSITDAIPGISIDATSWSTLCFLFGLGALMPSSNSTDFILSGDVGLMLAYSPEITLSSSEVSITENSSSATSFAYGFTAGLLFNKKVSLTMRVVSSEPSYNVTASSGEISFSTTITQPTTIVLVLLGLSF